MRRAILAILAATFTVGGSCARAAEPIRIGWLGSLSGPLSAAAQVINRGIEYSLEETNQAGGVNGRPLQLVTRDTTGDPTKAVNLAQEEYVRRCR